MAKNTEAMGNAATENLETANATKTEEPKITEQNTEEREDIFIERAPSGDDPNLLVSINGKNFLLPRGEISNVPKYVADEIRRSQRAQSQYDRRSRQMIEASK